MKRFGLMVGIVCIVGIVITIMSRESRLLKEAKENLERGRIALMRDNLPEAKRQLEQCLSIWPRNAEANFLAAQTARKLGELEVAESYLKKSGSLGRPSDDIEPERLLLEAQSGKYSEVEPKLMKHLLNQGAQSAEIIAFFVPIYLGNFRLFEADDLTKQWVELCPESPKAWSYRADVLERLQMKRDAVFALRKWVDVAPKDHQAKLNLARMLIDTKQPVEEAITLLDSLIQEEPENTEVMTQLAAGRELQGRLDEAAAILDRVLAVSTLNAKTLYYRGRIELNRGGPAKAVTFLKRAIELDPSDVQQLYTYYQCIQQTGTPEEIREAEVRWKKCDADLKRVGELSKLIANSPNDPNLRREIGELFLRNGKPTEGIRWLESALTIDPNHQAIHRVLAEQYKKLGQMERANKHKTLTKNE